MKLSGSVPFPVLAAVILLPTAFAADREALVAESFDYEPGGVESQSGGEGFRGNSSWRVTGSDEAEGAVEVTEESLEFSDFPTEGNRLTLWLDAIPTEKAEVLQATRSIDFTANNGDLWVAFLYSREDGGPIGSRIAEIRIDGKEGVQFGMQPKMTGSSGGTIRYDESPGTGGGDFQKGVFLIVAKFDSLGESGGKASMWCLDESAYDQIKGAGVTESELGNPTCSDTLAADKPKTLVPGDSLKIIIASSESGFRFSVDELRVGPSLSSVLEGDSR